MTVVDCYLCFSVSAYIEWSVALGPLLFEGVILA